MWGQKDCGPLMPINPVGICQQKDGGISYGDLLWGQLGHLLFPPLSGKLLLTALGGTTVGQGSACQMHHACHLETMAFFSWQV